MLKPEITVEVDFDTSKLFGREQQAKKHALWYMGQALIAEAQRLNLVPLDTGALRRSAVVTLNKLPSMSDVYDKAKPGDGDRPVVVDNPESHNEDVDTAYVSYNTPYAARLHEDMTWNPRDWRRTAGGKKVTKPAVGGPKWIEKAEASIRSKLPGIAARIMRRYL